MTRLWGTRIRDFVSVPIVAALVFLLVTSLSLGTLVALATFHWGDHFAPWQLAWWSLVSAALGISTFRIANAIFGHHYLYGISESYLCALIDDIVFGIGAGIMAIGVGIWISIQVIIDNRVANTPVEHYWLLPIGAFISTVLIPVRIEIRDTCDKLRLVREKEEREERKRAKRCAEVTSLQRIEFEDRFLLAVYSTTDGDTRRIELGDVWSRLNEECAPELTPHAIRVWRERKCLSADDKINVTEETRLSLTAIGRDLCMRAISLDSMQKALGERQEAREIVMGDKYEVSGQAGAVGREAHAHNISFQQIWTNHADRIDLQHLAVELETLRQALRAQATTREHDTVVAEIGAAASAAERGDGPGALHRLKGAGNWALNAATSIGTTVAAAAIRAALGM